MSDGPTGTPERRTVVIGDATDDVPGTGGPIDPLLGASARGAGDAAPTSPTSVTDVWTLAAGDEPAAEAPAGEGGVRTIVISGDELPDATYTVQPARTPDDPKGPRVHPRMKARRIAVRQAAGRRKIWWTAVFGVVLLLGLGALAVFSSSLFAVDNIRVSGAVNSDPAQIAEITRTIKGQPILTADLNGVRRRLEELPWVRAATVKMDFPHTVLVQIAERTPVAAFQSADNRWRVIDIDGRVIDVLAGRPIDYVAIFGPGPDKIAGEDAPEFAPIAQFITALPPRLRPLVQQFEFDQDFNVSMTLKLRDPDETAVDLCAAKDLRVEQLVSLTAFIETRLDSKKSPPARITACKPDLITTSDS